MRATMQYTNTTLTQDDFYTQDKLTTITVKTKSFKQESCTNLTAWKVMQNAQQLITNCFLEQDSTGARHYGMCPSICNSVVEYYYSNFENDFFSIDELLHCITQHLEYYDDESLFDDCVKDTALAKFKCTDVTCLSN